ncbi:MAG: dephospho-CoA kinase [Flavobacteriales bacterium]
MLRVGITGGIGSGKSTVCRILQVLGVPVFNADREAKRLLNEDDALRSEVMARFGAHLYPDGTLDRKAMAGKVFRDAAALADLNALVHPVARRRFSEWAEGHGTSAYVVMEAAILLGTGGAAQMDHIVVVACPVAERMRRVMERDGMQAEEVEARMSNQLSDGELAAGADTLILNDGTTLVTPQVLDLHRKMLACATR